MNVETLLSENRPRVRRYEPLAPTALALMAGIVLADALAWPLWAWLAIAGVAAVAWAALRRRGAAPGATLVPLLVLVAAACSARYGVTVAPPANDVARLVRAGHRLARIEGILVASPHETLPPQDVFLPSAPYYVRCRMAVECERAHVDGAWRPAGGLVQVTVREALPDEGDDVRAPHLGDRITVMGTLAMPAPAGNPGGFDRAAYLARQGVRACLYTDHWEAVQTTRRCADPWRWAVGAMGRWALGRFQTIRSEEGRAVAAAVLLGRRDLLNFDAGETGPQNIERAFVVTGTAHYLAVSGFNVGLAATVVLLLTRLAGLGRRVSAVLVAAVVLAYVMMTELQPPVLRAAILVWVLCLAWLVDREPLRLNTLAAAVIAILVVRPGDIFTTSFQLSFAVVLGMCLLVEPMETVLRGRYGGGLLDDVEPHAFFSVRRYARRTAAMALAASAVAVPLAAIKFHLLAWLAPVATVMLAPLMFGLMAGSMVLVVIGAPLPWIGDLVAAVPDGMARAIVGVVTALARVPGGHLYVADISPVWLVAAYGLLAAWVLRERLSLPPRRLALAALAAAAMFVWTTGHRPPAHVRATFLSVGNGLTSILQLPNGRVLLADAGSSLSYPTAAEAAIAPSLWAAGIDRVDAVLLSHAHFDHFKDVLPLVDRFGIRQALVPPTFLRRRLRSDDAVIKALLARGVRVQFFGAGDRLAGTGDVDIRAVWPRGGASMAKEINDGSLALVVCDGPRALLLTGDLETPGIDALLAAEPGLRADVLLWPHHGHAPAAVRRLLETTGAGVAVVSARRPYSADAPPPAWLAERGVAYLHTGVQGAVTVELAPAAVRTLALHGAGVALDAAASDEGDALAGD